MSDNCVNPAQEASFLIGAWRITSVALANGGDVRRGDGSGTDGMIIYGPGGFMTAHIVLPLRAANGVAADQSATSHHAYFGSYTVDTVERVITHHRFANNNPGLPTDVFRRYLLSGKDRLVLTPKGGPGDHLSFERVTC